LKANLRSVVSFVLGVMLASCHIKAAHPVGEVVNPQSSNMLPTDFCRDFQLNPNSDLAHTIRVLNKSLSKDECEPMLQSLMTTRHLDLANRNIADITPLQFATSLASLDLSQNLITDLRPIAGLSSLKRLYVASNKLTALPSPNKWTEMLDLNVSSNYIGDISALISMVSLQSFDVSRNRIRSAQPLHHARSLKVLYAEGNGIEDITPIASIVGLQQLHIAKNAVFDIRPLADLAALNHTNYLDLRENPINRSGCPIHGESLAVTSFCQSIFFDRN